MIQAIYPACLCNNHNLQLGRIQLRYLDVPNIPSLMTIYELEKSSLQAYQEISSLLVELTNNPGSDYAIKGIFSLGLANFETMFLDQLSTLIRFFPNKISLLKNKYDDEKGNKLKYSTDQLFNGEMSKKIIESEVGRLGYANLEFVISAFLSVFNIKSDLLSSTLDELIEIKETRNLLLHNNLNVNELYLIKTRSIKRASNIRSKLTIDQPYAIKSLTLLLNITTDLIEKTREKYGKYKVLRLIKELWQFSFEGDIISIENFCHLNDAADIFDGPFTLPEYCSSSETFFLEFWRAQRSLTGITRPSLVHLDNRNIRKLAFLTEVFGELRFPHW